MFKGIITIALILTATCAAAQDNLISIYFDESAETMCTDISGNQVGYIIATGVTYELIYAWEASFVIHDQGIAGFINHVRVPATLEGLQIGTAPNVIMAFSTPVSVEGPVVIGEFDFGFYGMGVACLELGANDANPSIPGEVAVQVGPTAQDIVAFALLNAGGTCAGIGADCEACVSVPNNETSFGGLKALYR
jgi:hypothetical protein